MDRALLSAGVFFREGKLFIPHRDRFDAALTRFHNGGATLTLIEDPRHSRQLEKFYWGVCIHRISEETGFDEQQAHELMKEQWLPRGLHAFNRGSVCWRCARLIGGTTTTLDREEQWRYVEDVQRWAVSSLGLILPDPQQELVAA